MKTVLFAAVAAMISLCPFEREQTSIKHHIYDMATTSCSINVDRSYARSIVMQDAIILLTDTGNNSEDIEEIEIFELGASTPIRTVYGCYAPSCLIDLSVLASGDYHIVVKTDLQNSFSGNIVLN